MTVFKYPARVRDGAFKLEMHHGAVTLAVQEQDGVPCLWACVSTWQPKEDRWFRWYGTGHDIDTQESPAYVGTVQMGQFVWHLFEVKPAETEIDPWTLEERIK